MTTMTTMTTFGREVMEQFAASSDHSNMEFSKLMQALSDAAAEIDYTITHDGVYRTSDETHEAFKNMLEGYAEIYCEDMNIDKSILYVAYKDIATAVNQATTKPVETP